MFVIAALIDRDPSEDMLDAVAVALARFGIYRTEIRSGRVEDVRLFDDGDKPSDKQLWFARKLLKNALPTTSDMRASVAEFAKQLASATVTRQVVSEIIDGLQRIE